MPTHAKIFKSLGDIYASQGNLAEALSLYTTAQTIEKQYWKPLDVASMQLRIRNVYWKEGRLSKALNSYENAYLLQVSYLEEPHLQMGYVLHNIFSSYDVIWMT